MISIKVAVLLTSYLVACVHSTCPSPTEAPTCSAGYVYGEAPLPPSCPRVKYITNFSFEKATGGWYRSFSTRDATAAGCYGDCVTIFIAPFDGTNYIVTECCRQGLGLNNICNAAVGSGTLRIDPNVPGVVNYVINGVTRIVYILDADPELKKYCIIYSCKTDCQGNSVEVFDIVTRSIYITPEDEAYYFNVLSSQGINIKKIKRVSQYVGCPYMFYQL